MKRLSFPKYFENMNDSFTLLTDNVTKLPRFSAQSLKTCLKILSAKGVKHVMNLNENKLTKEKHDESFLKLFEII